MPVAVLDEMLHHAPRSDRVLHQNGVDRRVGDRPVKGHNRSLANECPRESRLTESGGNHQQAIHMPLQHLVCLCVLRFRILVRGGDDHRIAVLLGHGGHRVRATGKERIVEIRNDQADGVAALTAKCARQHVGAVLELLDRGLHALRGFSGNANRPAQNPGDGHGAHAGQPGHVAHRGLAVHHRRRRPMFRFACRYDPQEASPIRSLQEQLAFHALAELSKVRTSAALQLPIPACSHLMGLAASSAPSA